MQIEIEHVLQILSNSLSNDELNKMLNPIEMTFDKLCLNSAIKTLD